MDLLIVADPRDAFAGLLAGEVRRRGRTPVVLRRPDAARLFTVSGDADGTTVEPGVPILLRPPAPARPNEERDDAFLEGECGAVLWAAAALTRAPVLNRPTGNGFEARWSSSGAVTERRADSRRAPELYGCSPAGRPAPSAEPWALEDSRGRTRPWLGDDTGEAPYRARPLLADERYERVVVLGDRAWRTTTVPLETMQFETCSSVLAGRLGLAFCCVTWGIDETAGTARLARIDPYPRADQVLPVWNECVPALLEYLQC